MSQPTPGPWWRDGANVVYGPQSVWGALETIAHVYAEADARLIVAAPELLEAAKELLETFFTATNDVANGLRIAVAKAEGRDVPVFPVSLQEEIDRS